MTKYILGVFAVLAGILYVLQKDHPLNLAPLTEEWLAAHRYTTGQEGDPL